MFASQDAQEVRDQIRQGFDLLAAALLVSIGGGNGDALTVEGAVRKVDQLRHLLHGE